VEGGEAGGGRRRLAQRRPGELHRQPWKAEQGRLGNRAEEHVREEEEEREGVRGPIWKSQKLQGPLGKQKFSTDVEI
jgi:hypothetical protein